MPWLRSMGILNDIHTVFTEEDFNLKSYEARPENNQEKWQFCVNVNGTVTAVAQCYAHEACTLYLSFIGNGRVELWDGLCSDYFLIDRDKYTSKEISEQFHEWITKTYTDAFEDGGYQVLPFVYPGKLSTNKIILQLYSVFDEWTLISTAPIDFIPNDASPKFKKYVPPKFKGFVDGKLILEKWIDIWEDHTEFSLTSRWKGLQIDLAFDGSNFVTISKVGCDDCRRVEIQRVDKYIFETYTSPGRFCNRV